MVTKVEITAEKTGTGEATVQYDLGDTVAELVEQFGEEVCYSRARQSLIIAIQAYVRGQIEAGKTAEEIQLSVAEWKPGVRRPAKSPEDRAREALGSMSAEQRAAFLKELRAKSH